MGFGTELFETLRLERRPLADASALLVSHPLFPVGAPEWMTSQYHVIRATVPTLTLAADACDRVAGEFGLRLKSYFSAKLFDERGHDVELLQDLERLGKSRNEVSRAPADPDVLAMVGSQFYLAACEHPAAYLGFIATLEAFPPSLDGVDAWAVAAGIPPEATTCARTHAKADVAHREDLRAILDLAPEDLRPLIQRNTLRCVEHQRRAVLALTARLTSLRTRATQQPESAHV